MARNNSSLDGKGNIMVMNRIFPSGKVLLFTERPLLLSTENNHNLSNKTYYYNE